jgi:hypothetical protein
MLRRMAAFFPLCFWALAKGLWALAYQKTGHDRSFTAANHNENDQLEDDASLSCSRINQC